MVKIGIAGLGCSGSYLANMLSRDGFEVHAFDPKRDDYYIPCGYAANANSMEEFMNKAGMDFSAYVLSSAGSVVFTGENMPEIEFGSSGLCTFDKNRLERDLIARIPHSREKLHGDFDLVVDATGISRSLLGAAKKDFTMFTKEYVCDASDHDDFFFRYFSRGQGYFWEFPIGSAYHIGAGSSSLDLIDASLSQYHPKRITARKIRLKPLFDEMVSGKIIGAGESIGTVSPVTGEGIVPSIECADLLFRSIRKYDSLEDITEHYTESVKKRFAHYVRLYDLLVNFRSGSRMSLGNVLAVRSVSRTMREFGIDFRISKIVRHLV